MRARGRAAGRALAGRKGPQSARRRRWHWPPSGAGVPAGERSPQAPERGRWVAREPGAPGRLGSPRGSCRRVLRTESGVRRGLERCWTRRGMTAASCSGAWLAGHRARFLIRPMVAWQEKGHPSRAFRGHLEDPTSPASSPPSPWSLLPQASHGCAGRSPENDASPSPCPLFHMILLFLMSDSNSPC